MNKLPLFPDHEGMPLNTVRRRALNEFNEMIYLGEILFEQINQCFCGSINLELLSRFDRYGLPFGTQICTKCGLILQTINIKEESMPYFYDNFYWQLIYGTDEEFEFSTQFKNINEFLPFISEQVHFASNQIKILEVGVGQGNRIELLGKELGKHFKVELYGCDFSTKALKNSTSKGINTIQGGMEQCLNIGTVDILIMSHVFEHFVDLKNSLDLIDKLTHEHSLIYVEVPGVVDLENKREYMYDYQDYSVLAHVHNFSLSSLTNVFNTKGFMLEKGTEFVRAIFRKRVEQPQEVKKNAYAEIMDSLRRSREKYLQQMKQRNQPIKKYIRTLVKAVLGKV